MEYHYKGGRQEMKKRLVEAYLSKDKPSYFVIEITGATLADIDNLFKKTDKLFDLSFELKNDIIFDVYKQGNVLYQRIEADANFVLCNLQILFDEGFTF